jgi:N utilization substance protein A
VREVYIDDETREATVIVPSDQLALAIGKEGLNARLATRLTGWKIDIQSEAEFAQAEADAAYAGAEDGEEHSGRCGAVLSNGKRCPNASLPGSRYCGVPAHQALTAVESAAVEVVAEDIDAAAALEEIVEEGLAAGEITTAEAEELTEAIEEVAAEAVAEDLEVAAELEEVLAEEEARSDG